MAKEMVALHSTGTWDLVPLPTNKSPIGCHLVYIVKIGPNGSMDRLKVRLVAKGYIQIRMALITMTIFLLLPS